MKGTLYIISSPSGAGKSSLLKALFEQHNNDNSMYLSVSHTTRPPRPGEVDHVHYHFVTVDEFKNLIDRQAFYEWAQVFDKYYGTSRELVQQALQNGQDVFLDIDWQGARQMRKMEPEAKSIFILPPSLEELRQRLVKRAQDSEEVIANRMNKAQREISHYNEYDYCLINDDFDQTLNDLWSIINANRHTRVILENNEGEILKNLLAGYDRQDNQS
ncbi:MAG: guanylate kinase [Ruminobacter sp.]|uniref:guanylate kinase n=1 Tax=Ruminobacter sp. TaxID=2774296 RepID=UPI001B5CF5EF|nr:guanylate kinase [Ruminobacter sp.]MBP3749092.1 guanylate kinase [Ruminobacter sp.]